MCQTCGQSPLTQGIELLFVTLTAWRFKDEEMLTAAPFSRQSLSVEQMADLARPHQTEDFQSLVDLCGELGRWCRDGDQITEAVKSAEKLAGLALALMKSKFE